MSDTGTTPPRRGDWHAATWRRAAQALPRKLIDDEVPGRAAQMSFFFFLSVFPTVLILMTALGLFLDAQWLVRETFVERLAAVAPESTVRLFTRLLDHVDSGSSVPLTWGVVLLLWAASNGMVATIRGLNKAWDVAEQRPWWRRRLVGLALTASLVVLVVAAMLLLAYGEPLAQVLADGFGVDLRSVALTQLAPWPLIISVVLVAFDLLYCFGPHLTGKRWHWLRPGTLVAIVLWLAASLGLKYYTARIDSYSLAYGSLGAVIVVLLWFYLTSLAILVGAEINALIDDDRGRTTSRAARCA